jgi:hypothetical protein
MFLPCTSTLELPNHPAAPDPHHEPNHTTPSSLIVSYLQYVDYCELQLDIRFLTGCSKSRYTFKHHDAGPNHPARCRLTYTATATKARDT